MAKAFEEHGYVWLPGAEHEAAYAHVQFDPDFGTRLTVINAAWATEPHARWATVLGESMSGQPWTLFEVRWRESVPPAEAGSSCRAELSAWRFVAGMHADTLDDIEFEHLHLLCHGMREWLTQGHDGRPSVLQKPEDADRSFWGSVQADVDGCQLSFAINQLDSGSWYRTSSEATASLGIQAPEPLSLPAWENRWVTPMRNLFVFAMRRPSAVTALNGVPRRPGDAGGYPPTVVIHEAWLPSMPVTRWTDYNGRMLLPANAVDDLAALLTSWIDLHRRLGDAAEFLFGTQNNRELPSVNKLLNLLAFAETYHRRLHDRPHIPTDEHRKLVNNMLGALPDDEAMRHMYRGRLQYANTETQRQRLRWLVDNASRADGRLGEVRKPLVSSLVETRNQLTHFDGESQWVTKTPFGYSVLAAALEYVLEADILLDLGLDEESVARCLRSGHGWDDPIPELPGDEAPGRFLG